MATQIKLRRGTTAEHETFTGALAELTVDTTKKELRLHDGVTQGGISIPQAGMVTEALDKRTVFVGSVAELEALSLVEGVNVYLTQAGRAGDGVIRSGTHFSDPQKGIFIDLANGNHWERSEKEAINPRMFGAIFDGVSDDATAIQACFDFLKDSPRAYSRLDIGGEALIGSKVVLDAPKVKTINGSLSLSSGFSTPFGEYVMEIRNCGSKHWVGKLEVLGSGGVTYSTRGNVDLMLIINSSRFSIDALLVSKAKRDGLVFENSNLCRIGTFQGSYCGCTPTSASLTLAYSFTSTTNFGSSGSTSQYTELQLGASEEIADYIDGRSWAKIGNDLYYISSIDNVSKKISIYPWIDPAIASGTVEIIAGSGIGYIGSDAGQASYIGVWDATGNGIGYYAQSLYPPVVGSLVTQACGIGVGISQGASASVGGSLQKAYFETNKFDVVQGTSAQASFEVLGNTALTISKCLKIAPRLTGGDFSAAFTKFSGISIVVGNSTYPNERKKEVFIAGSSGGNISVSIALDDYILDENLERLFGEKPSYSFVIRNISAGGITDVTINAVTGGTINGAPSYTHTATGDLVIADVFVSTGDSAAIVRG